MHPDLFILFVYLFVINVITFIVYGIDKYKAKHAKWRVPEATLLGLAVIGGSIGAWLGMKVWRHKTLHKKFRIGVPLILVAQIALFAFTSCGTKQKTVNDVEPIEQGNITEHSSSVFLVTYDAEVGKKPLLKAVKKYKCEVVYDYGIINSMALKKPENKTLEETMQYFKKVKGVVSVGYDNMYRLTDPVKPKMETE